MLETIKSMISEDDYPSFSELFTQYVMDVQDRNIEIELKFLKLNNNLTIKSMTHLIRNTFERINLDDKSH